MRPEHRLFAHHYIISGDKEKAYSFVYPKASGESLKVNARRLLRRKEIREFVDRELTVNAQQVLAARLAEEERRIAEEYATLALTRKKLRAIITGEHKVKRYFKYKSHIEVVEEECSPTAILRAIDTDSKLVQQFFALKNASAAQAAGQNKYTPGATQAAPPPPDRDRGYSLPLPPMYEGHDIPKHLQLQEMIQLGGEEYFSKHYGPDYLPGMRAKEIKEHPWKEKGYRERGERILDYIPTEDEFMAMLGVHAYNKKLELARREEAKQMQQSGQGIPGNPDGTVDIPEVIPSTRDIDPMSIPELFPDNEDHTIPPPGGDRGASSRRTDNTSEGAGSLTTYKIIVNDTENEQKGTKEDDDPAFPPELLANPFFKQPDPSLRGKINPMAFTRDTVRKKYTPQEIEEMNRKNWHDIMNDPTSVFNDPDSEYYIPPENRDPGCPNPTHQQSEGTHNVSPLQGERGKPGEEPKNRTIQNR